MATGKYLIVNADDFGQSAGVNRGIIEAFERGIVTSASLMVRWPAASDAARYSREHSDLSVGLHVDLGEWAFRNGEWMRLYEVIPAEDREAAAAEIAQQMTTFRTLIGRDPTHIDSHQHVHRSEPVRSILMELAHEISVPLRNTGSTVHYCGSFYGQSEEGESLNNINTSTLIQILSGLPDGFTELGCHPAKEVDLDTMYRQERLDELAVLCDERVRRFMDEAQIQLASFHSLQKFGNQ